MKLTSLLFKISNSKEGVMRDQDHDNDDAHHPQWPWPPCKSCPKTLSFRVAGATGEDQIFKTVNSVFLDPLEDVETPLPRPDSCFTTSTSETSVVASVSTESDTGIEEEVDAESVVEVLVRGARSDRLFFEPGDTSSILEEAKTVSFPFKESVVLAMESENPYMDFRRSMEEMVESHGLRDWECLEELLGWYLRVNGKKNHGFIVEAFVDLLIALASNNDDSRSSKNEMSRGGSGCSERGSTGYSSAASCFSASPSSSLKGSENEIYEEDRENMTGSGYRSV